MPRRIITNICFINRNKKTISEILSTTKSPNHIIDLNKVVPIPIDLISFPVDSISYKQFYLEKYYRGDRSHFIEIFNKSSNNDIDDFINKISSQRKEYACGKKMYENEKTWGVPTWREFIKKNWGLGNNTCYGSSMFNVNTISIDTFNQYPKPIIKEISKIFHSDIIEVKYASEIPGEYAKSFKMLNGNVISTDRITDKRLIYCELFRKNPNIFIDIHRKTMINNIIKDVN